jgi:hypothetical protein
MEPNDPADQTEYEPPFVISFNMRDFTWGDPTWIETAAIVATTTAVIPYVNGIATELAKKTIAAAPKVYRSIHLRLRYNKKGIKSAEVNLTMENKRTIIVLDGELSDEAHMALMELDFTDRDIAGKAIYWDEVSSSWKSCGPIKRRRIWRRRLR